MILFVLEGKAEDRLFDSLRSLFFQKTAEAFKCVYRSNIYSLYSNYSVSREDCQDFKELVSRFSFYKSWDDFLLSNNPNEKEEKKQQHFESAKRNWLYLIEMNVTKANLLCCDKAEMPAKKSDIAQPVIFEAQLEKFVKTEDCAVSILNSFPIFLYEYLDILPTHS